MDQTADHQSRQHNHNAFVVRNDHTPAGGRKINVIDCGYGILASVGSPDREGNEGSNSQMLADITCHIWANLRQGYIRSKPLEFVEFVAAVLLPSAISFAQTITCV